MGIPTKAYYAVEEVKENATQKSQKVFVHVPSEIAAHDVQKLLFCCLILLLSSVLFLTVTVRSPIFKAVPRKRFHNVVVKNGLGLTVACMAMSSATGCPADETNLTGVGQKQEGMVLGDMHLKPGEAWEYCPREALRRVSKILKDEFNLVMYAGFESEFYLLKSALREGKEEWFSFDTTPYCSASAFDAASPVLHEVVAALQSLNIAVEQAGNGGRMVSFTSWIWLLALWCGHQYSTGERRFA